MQTDDRQIDRRVQNELLFRAVNEKLRGLNAEFEAFSDDQALFVCECSRIDCIAQVELAVAAFDEICALPHRYLVLPEHEVLEIERVVERRPAYLVVEKLQAI